MTGKTFASTALAVGLALGLGALPASAGERSRHRSGSEWRALHALHELDHEAAAIARGVARSGIHGRRAARQFQYAPHWAEGRRDARHHVRRDRYANRGHDRRGVVGYRHDRRPRHAGWSFGFRF